MAAKIIIIISRCQKIRSPSEAIFHFKGFYQGYRVSEIKILGKTEWKLGQDYFLRAQESSWEGESLVVNIISWKELNELEADQDFFANQL